MTTQTLQRLRTYAVNNLSRNLELISSNKDVRMKNMSQVQFLKESTKPLAVLLPWMNAKRSAVLKYADLYVNQDFDVLVVRGTPYQVLRPVSGSQVVAKELAYLLHSITSSHQPIIVHGFSVGAYIWSETMVAMNENLDGYHPTIDRIAGQIWDSLFADIEATKNAIPFSIFPKSKVLQKVLGNCLEYYFEKNRDTVLCHFLKARNVFFETNLVSAPALFLASKTDQLSTVATVTTAHDMWRSRGIESKVKCWDDSPHVGHFRAHPEEYLAEWSKLLSQAGLLPHPERFRVNS